MDTGFTSRPGQNVSSHDVIHLRLVDWRCCSLVLRCIKLTRLHQVGAFVPCQLTVALTFDFRDTFYLLFFISTYQAFESGSLATPADTLSYFQKHYTCAKFFASPLAVMSLWDFFIYWLAILLHPCIDQVAYIAATTLIFGPARF